MKHNSRINELIEAAQIEMEVRQERASKMKLGDKVIIKAGHQVGMKTLAVDTPAVICRTDKDVKGNAIYCVEWYDHKGNRKSTWINPTEGI